MDKEAFLRVDEPIDAVMPAFSQDVAIIVLWALFAVYLAIGVHMLVKKKDDTFLLLALGGLLASPAEPFTCFMVKI